MPPTVQITSPDSGVTVVRNTKVYVTASDNIATTRVDLLVDGKLYSTSSSGTPVFSWGTSKISRGPHTLQAVAYDAAGNAQTSSAVTLTVSIDITPPTIVISTPTNGQLLTTSILTVTGTATDPGIPASGLNVVQLRVNGGSWSNASGTTSWTRSVTLSPCPNTIEARSLDKTGNYSVIASNFVTYMPPNTVPNTPANVVDFATNPSPDIPAPAPSTLHFCTPFTVNSQQLGMTTGGSLYRSCVTPGSSMVRSM